LKEFIACLLFPAYSHLLKMKSAEAGSLVLRVSVKVLNNYLESGAEINKWIAE
jgi:hypothetical protein